MSKNKYTIHECLKLVTEIAKLSLEAFIFILITYFVMDYITDIGNLYWWFPITWATALITAIYFCVIKDI